MSRTSPPANSSASLESAESRSSLLHRPTGRRVTQKDIAKIAGVHNTTVSLALRHDASIPAATRERITRVAAQLGYRPDPAISALVSYRRTLGHSRRKRSIAYVTCGHTATAWRDSPDQVSYFEGARQEAKERDYELEHFWLDEPNMSPKRLAGILFHRGINGMVLAPGSHHLNQNLDFGSRVPHVVVLGLNHVGTDLNYVSSDRIGNVRKSVRESFRAGYQNPALVLSPDTNGETNHAMWVGFLAEQGYQRDDPRSPVFYPGQADNMTSRSHVTPEADGIQRKLVAWLHEIQPDVIIGSCTFVGDLLEGTGIEIPRHFALVDPHLDHHHHDVAGIRRHPFRAGEVAIEMLHSQLHENRCPTTTSHTTTLIEGTWIPGATLPRKRNRHRVAPSPTTQTKTPRRTPTGKPIEKSVNRASDVAPPA
ncbi:LacI family DNA-binding transcriptional regulator [Synoicihabitans lomoniglobus]|uniref:LacI family DNA-binding transcriptional regulator n=1 Tax=Synoicihabitans lomoniglobus TaxID=2909285 RepID=A0AAE9ZVA5_9BACT|nr:LacI family transcriptional regulator [Opitutaceae bacterium LMO-M01]WED63128.1 LacI family DNA-binding transcriptional regulator [Opitutaceae bacterium LMO-M01]